MGKLSDITANASNTGKRLSAASVGYQPLNQTPPSENHAKKAPPRFMSPTVSAAKQVNAKPSSAAGTATTPLTSSAKARASGNWMASAAKRVGFNRGPDGTPRSKEGFSKKPKSLSFPDKFATSTYVSLPDSPPSKKTSPKLDKAALDAKPLPSPPVVQIMSTSPLKQTRSLIDATEKPLRRSPPGKPHEEEEWPVLIPDRPITSSIHREGAVDHNGILTTANTSDHNGVLTMANTVEATYQPAERYPRLPSRDYKPLIDEEGKPQRKQVSSPNLRRAPSPPKPVRPVNKENIRPSTAIPNNATSSIKSSSDFPVRGSKGPSMRSQIPTVPTAGASKSSNDNKPSIEPRQTRTSSLRARLSAGPMATEASNSNKVNGFCSSTTSEPLATEKDIKRRSTPKPPGSYPVGPKLSRDSLRGKKPAQIVGGSRRPPSRGSLRSESRTLSNNGQPQFSDKALANTLPPLTVKTMESKVPEDVAKKSSIPVYRKNEDSEKTLEDEFTVFEDKDEKLDFPLDAIEESPYRGYHTRRLSTLCPDQGPTLKISPSADRIIMGTGTDKENETPKKKCKRRVLATIDVGSSSKDKVPSADKSRRVTTARPSSSLGLPESASRHGLLDSETRAKKVKSAEIDTTSKRLSHLGKIANGSRKDADASTIEDPFFDAQSSMDKRMSNLTDQNGPSEVDAASFFQDLEWVPPVKKHLSLTADSDALLQSSEVVSMLTQEENPTDSVTADVLSVMGHDDERSLVGETNTSAILTITEAPVGVGAENAQDAKKSFTFSEATPTTPEHSNNAAGSGCSGSLPPRSSSRTTHPDFVGNKHSPTSPLGNKETVPKEFTDRQNRLGSLRGHGTSQVDFKDPAPTRDSTRHSVARESNKSHSSVSKGVLLNIKGLFHKRSSDETFKSLTKNGKKNKQKASVTLNGSPFPAISDVHPIHRPTVSSVRRSKANGVETKTPLQELSTLDPNTPSFNSPAPSELAATTTVAMDLLEMARKEQSSPKKARLLELGKILVDSITQAREAEKAFEEAKHAARKAEVSYELCKRSVHDVKKVVDEWRDEMAKGGLR